MNEDIRGGEAAAARLARGARLDEVLDVDDPAAWTGLDAGVRAWGGYGIEDLPDKAWVEALDGATGPPGQFGAGRWAFRSSRRRAEPAHGPSIEPRLAVALCHPDGHIREAALARVAAHPALLPLVVIRAADWATPVRDKARELLRAGLDVRTGVALASLILLIGRRERGAYGVELLAAMLRRAPHGAPATLFVHPDRTVRRFAYRLAAEESLLAPDRFARTAARDDDVVVQSLCAEAALAAVREGAGLDEVLEPLLTARNTRARSAGVTALRRAGRPERALEFLADRVGPGAGLRAVRRAAGRERPPVLVPAAMCTGR